MDRNDLLSIYHSVSRAIEHAQDAYNTAKRAGFEGEMDEPPFIGQLREAELILIEYKLALGELLNNPSEVNNNGQ